MFAGGEIRNGERRHTARFTINQDYRSWRLGNHLETTNRWGNWHGYRFGLAGQLEKNPRIPAVCDVDRLAA